MKKFFAATIIVLCLCGCDYVAPDISKAITEKNQFSQQIEQTQLQKGILHELRRIADALERKNAQNTRM